MSSLTRLAASSFSLVTLPRIFVLTGPEDGNVSLMVSAWNRIAASASTVEYTPQASSQGSVRSSYLKPSTSRPLTNVSAHSLRVAMSASTSSVRSEDRDWRVPSSMNSARLEEKSSSPDSSFSPSRLISTLPSGFSLISTSPSGDSSSISSALGPAPASSSMPCGAAYNPGTMLLVAIAAP